MLSTESNVSAPLRIETWEIARFVPYARNPRKNDHAVERMAASIREFGFRVPVLARSSGDVIDGHLRLKAAAKLGITEIPVILCDDWTEAQVKAFRLLVNRSVTWADWDPELLSLEILDLRNLDFDIDLTGFDTQEIDELLLAQSEDAHEDDAPAAPENPTSEPVTSGSAASIGFCVATLLVPRRWHGCSASGSRG